jgi:hypothetical protein
MKLKRPSPAMIIACLALFAALTGGAYAAKKITKLPKNIVTAKSIKNGVVTEPKIKNGAVTQAKLAPGVGTAAYARVTNTAGVTSAPALDAANSKNVTVAAPVQPAPPTPPTLHPGETCIDASTAVKSIEATPESDTTAGEAIVAEVVLNPGAACPAGSDAEVITKNSTTGNPVNADFYVTLFS